MKKSWSICVATSALAWLLAFGASPAGAYYPPLQPTYTHSSTGWGFQVTLPDGSVISGGSGIVSGTLSNFQINNGIMAWIHQDGSNYYVGYTTFDPFRGVFPGGSQGPFTSVTQLQVMDGVVAYVVGIGIPPSGHLEPRFATYDPARQAWQSYGQNWYQSGMQIQSIETNNGVVLFEWYWPGMPTPYAFDCWLYDPLLGSWWGSGMDNFDTFDSITINNASVNYTVSVPGTDDTLYGVLYCLIGDGNGWHLDSGLSPRTTTTPPQAYFVAQPTSGSAPLGVWFTDMSIAGTSYNWDFGDNSGSTSYPSPYHTFTSPGTYQVSQQINGASTYNKTITVFKTMTMGGEIPSILHLLLLQN